MAKKPELGTKVSDADEICVDGKNIKKTEEKHVYIAFNKPIGIVCTTDTKREKNNIVDYINHPKRIFPIGRLDKPSEGLILLTSDGDIVNKILRARNNHEKRIHCTCRQTHYTQISRKNAQWCSDFRHRNQKCEVEQIDTLQFRIVLTSRFKPPNQKNVRISRLRSKKTEDIRIMNIKLDLPMGKWRDLTDAEMKELAQLLQDSSKLLIKFINFSQKRLMAKLLCFSQSIVFSVISLNNLYCFNSKKMFNCIFLNSIHRYFKKILPFSLKHIPGNFKNLG